MSYTFEFGNDFKILKEILMNRPKEDYPYQMDPSFDPDVNYEFNNINLVSDDQKFTLFAKDENGEVVATYAAQQYDYKEYSNAFERMTLKEQGTYYNPTVPDGVQWYSSCQWVHADHRSQRLGIQMDRMKKDEIWRRGGDVNYANCKEALKEYHVSAEGLAYDVAQHQSYIPSGGVGGAGSNDDRNYFLVYEVRT